MAQLTLQIHRFLSQGAKAESPGLEKATVLFDVGERLKDVMGRFATENRMLGAALFDRNQPAVRPGILVVLNDRIINPNEFATLAPGDGDDVTFLPMLDGG